MSVIPLTRTHRDTHSTTADLEIVVPVYNEEGTAGGQHHRPAHLPRHLVPIRRHDHHRRQREHRRHVADRLPICRKPSAASPPSTSTRRAGAAPCERRGHGARQRLCPTWMSTWPPGWTRCSHWSPRSSRDTAMSPSVPGSDPVPMWSGVPDVSSYPGPTTCCCVPRSGASAPMPSAASRPCAGHAAAELLPLVEDDEWFFDTEVLVTAQRIGLRIHEVPVDWVDDVDSRVAVAPDRAQGPAAESGACSVLPPGEGLACHPAKPATRRARTTGRCNPPGGPR